MVGSGSGSLSRGRTSGKTRVKATKSQQQKQEWYQLATLMLTLTALRSSSPMLVTASLDTGRLE